MVDTKADDFFELVNQAQDQWKDRLLEKLLYKSLERYVQSCILLQIENDETNSLKSIYNDRRIIISGFHSLYTVFTACYKSIVMPNGQLPLLAPSKLPSYPLIENEWVSFFEEKILPITANDDFVRALVYLLLAEAEIDRDGGRTNMWNTSKEYCIKVIDLNVTQPLKHSIKNFYENGFL